MNDFPILFLQHRCSTYLLFTIYIPGIEKRNVYILGSVLNGV